MREAQAVLARNVLDDSQLGNRDSKGDILAASVICAPIRRDGLVLGVIHLYSTDVDRSLDPDDLEFTLAVADTVAVALENLSRRQELAENLDQVLDENVQLREQLGVQSEIVGSGPDPKAYHAAMAEYCCFSRVCGDGGDTVSSAFSFVRSGAIHCQWMRRSRAIV